MKGGVVPPAAAFQKELVSLGVASTLTERARQTLERSAEQAGFYESGRDRLVLPGFAPSEFETEHVDKGGAHGNGGGGNGGSSGSGDGGDNAGIPRHPLIAGLFKVLPPDGATWSLEEAEEWLQAAATNLRFAYKYKGTIKVEIVMPSKSASST